MSPWAPDSTLFYTGGSSSSQEGPLSHSDGEVPSPRVPLWVRIAPFFLSAFFYLSAFFAIFSPLPVLLLFFRSGRQWAWLALVTNLLIVAALTGLPSALIYLVFAGSLALTLAECLVRGKSLERTTVMGLVSIALLGVAIIVGYSLYFHVHPLTEIRSSITEFVDFLGQSMSKDGGNAVMDKAELEEWKKDLLFELPSAVGILSLILIWANLVILLRINPKRIRERLGLDPGFIQRWKAPEFLVWPTIVIGFFVLIDVGLVSDIARNLFKFLMAIYAIQGLSILSFLFDTWNVRGIFRLFGYIAVVFLMMPLLLSLGFFDLWFDFRRKFRQS